MSAHADDPLLSAAGKISSGEPVDWGQLQDQMTTPAEAAVAEELQSLERVAQIGEQAPATWGRFQIISEIGRGTFGTVYCALDPTLQIDVALKVIRSRAAGVPIDPERALAEARRLVKVKHPNVVRAYGAELIDNEVGLSLELVKGHTLDAIVREHAPFSANESTIIGIDLCRALAAVHRADMLHGDIKAHNVMRENGGRTVLMDFGTGRNLKREPHAGDDFAGTPLYLAPEVFAGQLRTPASEIYSLGVLLYFLVTGSYPVEGDSRTNIRQQHERRGRHRPLRDVRPDLPDDFIHVVERATAENPAERYGSAGELEAALARVLAPPRREQVPIPVPVASARTHGKRLAILAALAVLVVGLAAFAVDRMQVRVSRDGQGVALDPETVAAAARSTAPGSVGSYRIESAFYRESQAGVERLKPGATLAPGDALSLQVQTSVPMYFYVVNEDEQGSSFLLFPLPGHALQNPLPPGQRHRLPATNDGELISWEVTSAGLREHFLIVASPERSTTFDELFATLPQPVMGRPPRNARLSAGAIGVLRSVGGLTVSPAKVDRQLRLMPEFSTPLSEGEEPGQGVWIRHATFMNPDK